MTATTQNSVKAYYLDTLGLGDDQPKDVKHLIIDRSEDEIREAFEGDQLALEGIYEKLARLRYAGEICGVEDKKITPRDGGSFG